MFFRGSYVALVTPFKKDGSLDEEKIVELVNYHINNGTTGIVPCGTTGESPTLSFEEHKRVIKIVVEEAKGRIHVLAGAGANSTSEAIEFTKYAEDIGADSVLSVVPYYNKPTQEGIYQHFLAIANATNIPIMLYNVPGRTGVNMSPETICRLSKLENVKGVKEASGNLEQVCEIVNLCGNDIDVLSGDDALLLPMLSVGATGVVSVTANFMAKEVSDLINKFESGDFKGARAMHDKLFRISQSMFIEPNPVPTKTVMEILGQINAEVRLPLTPILEENRDFLITKLKEVENL